MHVETARTWQDTFRILAHPLVCLAAGLQLALGATLLPLAQDVELLTGVQQLEGVGRWRLSIIRPSSVPGTWRCRPLLACFAHRAGAG